MTTELDSRLRDAHAAVPAPDERAYARARARLDAAMVVPRRRRRVALVLPVAALVAAAAVVALALTPTRVQTPVAPPIAEAAKVVCARTGDGGRCLRALSTVAGGQSALAGGQVFYQRNTFTLGITYVGADGRSIRRDFDRAAYALTVTVPEELWLAPDGSGRLSYGAEDPPRPASAADERAWRAAGAPDPATIAAPIGEWGPKHPAYGPGGLDKALIFNSNLEAALPEDDPLSALPRDPQRLAAFLWDAARKQRKGGGDVENTFGTNVTTFLRYPRTPPELRAALLQVFATLPGTRSLGVIEDGAGRSAAALQLPAGINDGNDVIAFDPETSRLLGEGVAHDGSVRWSRVYDVQTGAVDSVGERP